MSLVTGALLLPPDAPDQPVMAVVMAAILAITAAPRAVKAVTAAAEIRAPATAYSTIVNPSSSRRNASNSLRMNLHPFFVLYMPLMTRLGGRDCRALHGTRQC